MEDVAKLRKTVGKLVYVTGLLLALEIWLSLRNGTQSLTLAIGLGALAAATYTLRISKVISKQSAKTGANNDIGYKLIGIVALGFGLYQVFMNSDFLVGALSLATGAFLLSV